MTKELKFNIMAFVLGLVGICIFIYATNFLAGFGLFLCMWGNNISQYIRDTKFKVSQVSNNETFESKFKKDYYDTWVNKNEDEVADEDK